jgi:hypothetical protein
MSTPAPPIKIESKKRASWVSRRGEPDRKSRSSHYLRTGSASAIGTSARGQTEDERGGFCPRIRASGRDDVGFVTLSLLAARQSRADCPKSNHG